jgi:hypothetical protein
MLSGNIIAYAHKGIQLLGSSNSNIIYHNNFINNYQNAKDSCTNNWDNGYPSGGNYWSDYIGNDNYRGLIQMIPGSDGIGDTSYSIDDGSNQDRYPFMESYVPPIITNVNAMPNPQDAGEEVRISCRIRIKFSIDLSRIEVNITGPIIGSPPIVDTMTIGDAAYDGTYVCYDAHYNNNYSDSGIYHYRVTAVPNSGDPVISATYEFEIEPHQDP